MDLLIAEDLLLLLLDDERGTLAASDRIRPLLGGALLVELALAGSVGVEENPGRWRSARVQVEPGATSDDPVLSAALAAAAEKPLTARHLVDRLGKGAREQLLDRLAGRGLVERRQGKVLGLFPHTTWPAAEFGHERAVRARLQDVLVTGLDPDPRTGALVALLAAIDRAHKVVDTRGPGTREVRARAKRIATGAWAAAAVREAVQASQGAMIAAVAATGAATAGS